VIRFIDLRAADIGARFAFFDTVTDTFRMYSGYQVWDNWRDFKQDYTGDELDRYEALLPDWLR